MRTNIETIKEIIQKGIDDECKENKVSKPDYISFNEWLIAFDVFEAHFLVYNMMDKYQNFMYWYVRLVTYYAEEYDSKQLSELFTRVCMSSGRLDNVENTIRFYDGAAICSEIDEKIKKYRNKEKEKQLKK